MHYLLFLVSTVSLTWPLDTWSNVDTEGEPLVIQRDPPLPPLRESITNSLSSDMLKRERGSAPSITFREIPPREPLERDIDRYLLNPAQ
ncbi:TPA: hypothetical protein P2Q89_001310 [Aeromonas veronii]|nr:hypothetical protein [Aeromonas veronii]